MRRVKNAFIDEDFKNTREQILRFFFKFLSSLSYEKNTPNPSIFMQTCCSLLIKETHYCCCIFFITSTQLQTPYIFSCEFLMWKGMHLAITLSFLKSLSPRELDPIEPQWPWLDEVANSKGTAATLTGKEAHLTRGKHHVLVIVIKPGSEIDPVKGPGPGFYGSTH
jgi:hypothetical protein